MRVAICSLALLLAFQACFTLGKVHHKHHKRSLGTFDLTTKHDKCKDHEYCSRYSQMDCASSFLKLNCKKLCGLCENHKKINLPMVLYYKKHGGGKTRVQRSANPTYPPTITKTLAEYKGNYPMWYFNFIGEKDYPVKAGPPAPFVKPADKTQQQNTATQQSNDANQTPSTQQQQTQQQTPQSYQQQQQPQQQQQAAYPAQQQNTYQPQAAAPQPAAAAPQPAQPAQPAVEQQQTQQQTQQQQQDVPAFRIPANAFKLADQGKDVYINVPKNAQTQNLMNSPLNDQPEPAKDEKMKDKKAKCDGTYEICFKNKPVKVPCPKGQECNWKGPNSPQINETFMIYCDDKFPNCGVLHSSCNDSWLQIYCPKRCGICKPNDSQPQGAQPSPIASDEGNKVYPSNVSELNDEPSVNIQSELVAPEPSDKPQRARYTLHVKPKLKNGVPQQQQIFIMPPNVKAGSNIKPLVILKQKVTKPMVENIEIDVPPKGIEYSDEPKVEVIEGSNHETLQVSEGKADLTKAEADLAQKSAAAQAAAAQAVPAAAPAPAAPAQPAADASVAPAPAPAPAAEPSQYNTQTQSYQDNSQTQAQTPAQPSQGYQDNTQAQAPAQPSQGYQDNTQAQAPAQPAQGYQDNTQAQAPAQPTRGYQDNTQTQTQSQAYPDNTQAQATQTQSTQDQTTQSYQQPSYDQSQQAAAPAATPTAAPAAYPAQETQQTANQCIDNSLCASYTKDRCSESWLQNNCKKLCNLC